MHSTPGQPVRLALPSRRLSRRIRFGLTLAVVVGGVALIVTLVPNTKTTDQPISTQPAQIVRTEKTVPRDPESVRIGRKFIETAVLRRNLDWAYDHVHPYLKGLLTRAAWDTGAIPVIPYPARNAATTEFVVVYSYQTEVLFEVDLVAKPGSGVRPHLNFYLGLRREGDRPTGRWLVSYWEPLWRPPVPYSG